MPYSTTIDRPHEEDQLGTNSSEATARQSQTDMWLRKAAEVCEQAAGGNLEARLLNIDVEADSDLFRILHSINSLLDYTDAFVREVKAVLACAAEEKFYRKVILRGMNGTFRQASILINNASDQMHAKSQKIATAEQQRLTMADDFEQTVKSVTISVSNTAEQLQTTASSLSYTAQLTSEKSNVLSSIRASRLRTCATLRI